MAKYLRVTYVKSSIGSTERQKASVRALGLRKLRQVNEEPDNPAMRGLVRAVGHLVTVEEVERAEAVAETPPPTAPARSIVIPEIPMPTSTQVVERESDAPVQGTPGV